MNPRHALDLLGGLTPSDFMRRYWQREPLLIRQAIASIKPPISVAGLKRLARRDDVESRLIWREHATWQMEPGPFARLPKTSEREWTLLVQGVDQHDDAVADLMHRFRFVPDARMDDIMISLAGDGGGVGPHFDSYDVFLLQVQGTRRWRIGRQRDLSLEPGLALKILRRFEPESEYVLEPGDMLYLPPHVAHDGVAIGADCMTLSIGFRAPTVAQLARGMLETAAERLMDNAGPDSARYRDAGQPAVAAPAELPDRLVKAALTAVGRVRFDSALAARYLGCWLTEPGPNAIFDGGQDAGLDPGQDAGMDGERDGGSSWPAGACLKLDRRTRLMYRGADVFINGEVAPLPANFWLRQLADERILTADSLRRGRLSGKHRAMLREWAEAGWLHIRLP